MPLPAILYTLSSIPLFASRPFLAAFATALVSRFGTELPWIGDHAIVVSLHAGPAWFQSTTCLVVLGVLAALEVLSARSPEVRQILEQVDGIVKGVVAALVSFAVIDGDTARTIDALRKAGFSEALLPVLAGGATFALAGMRRKVIELVTDIDDGDDLGLQSLLAWVEDGVTVLGVLFLLVFPVVAVVLAALAVLGIDLLRRRAERREERSRIPCAVCATPILPHASGCHACGREVVASPAVGVFGQARDRPGADRERHAFELAARKRCPLCATRLKRRTLSQPCPTCGRVTFASRSEFERYLAGMQARLPRTLLVALVLSAIPLLGIIPGVIYYRLNLVAGLRGYVPPLRGLTTRWAVRALHVGVIALQPIPLVGAGVLPFLCWSTFALYRRALVGRAAEELAPRPLPAGA